MISSDYCYQRNCEKCDNGRIYFSVMVNVSSIFASLDFDTTDATLSKLICHAFHDMWHVCVQPRILNLSVKNAFPRLKKERKSTL